MLVITQSRNTNKCCGSPPSDISNVNAFINDPLSLPTILISLSASLPISLVSPPSFTIEKKFVSPSKLISTPSNQKK